MQPYRPVGVYGFSLLLFLGCSAPEPKKITSTPKDSPVPADECAVPEVEDTDDALTLLQDVTYEKDIEPIVIATCALSGCHSAGAQSPPLATYAQNVEHAAASLVEINANTMPIGNPLSDAQKNLWAAWIDAGAIEGTPIEAAPDDTDTDADADSDTDAEPTAEDAECAVEDTTSQAEPDSIVVNQEAVDTCHAQGVIYDRNAKECGTALVDTSFDCDREGITKAFKDVGLNPKTILDLSLGDGADAGEGYQIDQCGETETGLPIVILVKTLEPPEVEGIKVRVIAVE